MTSIQIAFLLRFKGENKSFTMNFMWTLYKIHVPGAGAKKACRKPTCENLFHPWRASLVSCIHQLLYSLSLQVVYLSVLSSLFRFQNEQQTDTLGGCTLLLHMGSKFYKVRILRLWESTCKSPTWPWIVGCPLTKFPIWSSAWNAEWFQIRAKIHELWPRCCVSIEQRCTIPRWRYQSVSA